MSIIAVSIMVQRALNCVDPRLVDHGLRVAAVLDAMLEAKGVTDPTQRRAAYLVALLHDVGAYRTEEIDRMVAFETESVWEHSFYGYLFFKELTPLGAYADVILYHHLPYDRFTDQDPYVKFLAGAVHVADRVDVLLLERPQADVVEVERLLAASRPGAFSPEAVALFFEAQRRFDVLARLRSGVKQPDRSHIVDDPDGTGSASSFLDMLVHVIDFRSRHTVTHTVTTAWVAYELALRLIGDQRAAARVYTSALVGTRSYKKAYPKEKVLELLAWHVETGKIDCIVVETMTRDYDAIMLSVAAACQPVAAAYERVQSAYALMLGKLKRWQAENEGRSA